MKPMLQSGGNNAGMNVYDLRFHMDHCVYDITVL